MNITNIKHCRPMGSTQQHPGQVSLVIRNKVVRMREPIVVFIHRQQIYAVRADSATGINITDTDTGRSHWVGTYTTQATRCQIRDDLQEWIDTTTHALTA